MSKEEIKKIETRLNNLEARISPLKEENAKFEAEIKGLKFQQETFVKSFEQFMQEMIQRKGADEYKGIVDAIDKGFKDLIDYKKGFEAKMDARRDAPKKPPKKEKDEPMEVNIDISKINWQKSKRAGGGPATEYDAWAWAFAFDRQNNILPEAKDLFEATQHYGSVRIGDFVVTLGGDRGNLLNRKKT